MNSSILVIGAGTAGLSAASKLLRDGFCDVRVYEARDRLGGRIFTRRRNSNSPTVEFGAQWIHGQVNNPVFEICEREGLLSGRKESLYDKFYHWQQLDQAQNEFAEKLVADFRATTDECSDLCSEGSSTSKEPLATSLFDYLTRRVENYWLSKEEDDEKRELIGAVFDWFVRLQNEINGGEAQRVSANHFGEYKECEGNPVVSLGPGGYFGFLSVLLRDVPSHKVNLGVEVTEIDYETSPVKVTSSRGKESFDFVICTVPLGVLKERKLEMFTPQLPYEKLRTIGALGFGVCNKIFLEFDREDVFWQSGDSFQILWRDREAQPETSWERGLTRFNSVDRHPNLLLAWAAGESSSTMESESDEEVLRKCHGVLCMVMGKDVPKPIRIERSNWWSDPHSRGSYSYISTACDGGETFPLLPSTLAKPLEIEGKPVVCFAGEATSNHYFSTVHGAFESGQREAQRILEYAQGHPSESLAYGNARKGSKPVTEVSEIPISDSARPRVHRAVVVVGAGAAGLGAALRLAGAGIDFVVLEAQSEPGGRIRTQHCEGKCLELGAQWVHGERDNPLYQLCVEHDLLTDPKVDFSSEGKGMFFLPDGTQVPSSTVESAIRILDGVKEELASFKSQSSEKLNFKSVGEMYRGRFEETRSKGPAIDSKMRAIMDWYTKFEIVDNACKDIDNLSLSGFGHYVECPGVYYINFKNGYDSFTETVLRNLPRDSVQPSTPVEYVKWSEDSKIVEVMTKDGAILTCNHLILTPSVKILRDFDFRPPLPSYKLEALDCFGFDTIDKIFLYWDEPFWTPEVLGLHILWPEYDDEFFKEHGEFLRGIYGFEKLNHTHKYLLTWIGGDEAESMETLPDESVIDGCYALLKRFAGECFNVTRPSRVIRSSWGTNPYVKGAYSHRVLKFDELQDPVGDLQSPVCDPTGEVIPDGSIQFKDTSPAVCRGGDRSGLFLNGTRSAPLGISGGSTHCGPSEEERANGPACLKILRTPHLSSRKFRMQRNFLIVGRSLLRRIAH